MVMAIFLGHGRFPGGVWPRVRRGGVGLAHDGRKVTGFDVLAQGLEVRLALVGAGEIPSRRSSIGAPRPPRRSQWKPAFALRRDPLQ